MNASRSDLLLTCLWASALVAAVLLTDSVALRAVLGVPLVLVILGHAVLRGFGIRTATLAEHLTFAVGASVATCVIGGFVLHVAHALTPLGWAIWLWSVVVLASLTAAVQRSPDHWPVTEPRPSFRLRHGVALMAAALVAGSAVFLASQQERANRQFSFTEFWLVPEMNDGQLSVGVRSGEIETDTYDIEITLDGRPLASYRGLILAPGSAWHREIPVEARRTLQRAEARLVRRSDGVVYRYVSAVLLPLAS